MEFFLFLFFFLLRNESNQFKLPGCNNRTLPVEGRIVIQPASLSSSFSLLDARQRGREKKVGVVTQSRLATLFLAALTVAGPLL